MVRLVTVMAAAVYVETCVEREHPELGCTEDFDFEALGEKNAFKMTPYHVAHVRTLLAFIRGVTT